MNQQTYTVFFQPKGDSLSRGWHLMVGDRPATNDSHRPFRDGWGLAVDDTDSPDKVHAEAERFLAERWHVQRIGPWTGDREVWHVTGTKVDPATIVVDEEAHGTEPYPVEFAAPGNQELFTDHGLIVEEVRTVTHQGQDEIGLYLVNGTWYAVQEEVYAEPSAPVERFWRRQVIAWPPQL